MLLFIIIIKIDDIISWILFIYLFWGGNQRNFSGKKLIVFFLFMVKYYECFFLLTTIQGIIIIANPWEEMMKQKNKTKKQQQPKPNLIYGKYKQFFRLKWPKIFADQSKTKKNKIWYSKHTNQDEWMNWMIMMMKNDWLNTLIHRFWFSPSPFIIYPSIQQPQLQKPIMFHNVNKFSKKRKS